MEDLPPDVILIILHKVAAQDPPSFLRATFCSPFFHLAAVQDPNIWKDAFFGPEVRKGMVLLGEPFPEERAKLDAKVEELCGYENLVKARYSSAPEGSDPNFENAKVRESLRAI